VGVGAAYGASMPVVLTANVSYTPKFANNPNRRDKRSAINAGLTFGIHLPLIDMN
jgi:hypothetical protein